MNKLILLGNATKDPEVRYGNDNKPVARFGIAVQRKYKNKDGNYDTDFFNLVSFGKTAEFVEKYIKKGTKILVECELRNNNYEKDGKTVYSDQIVVNAIEFASSKNSQGSDGSQQAEVPNSQPTTDAGDGFNVVEEASEDALPFV